MTVHTWATHTGVSRTEHYSADEYIIDLLCTCPRCGHPAQREETPHGEGYITCGHCAAITFDRTEDDEPAAEFYAQAQAPIYERAPEHDKYTDAYAWRDRTTGQVSYHFIGNDPNVTPFDAPPPPDAMQEAVSLVHAMRHVPERSHSPRYAQERAAAGETKKNCPACGKVDHSPETCPRAALIAVTAGSCACGKPARMIVGGVLYCGECYANTSQIEHNHARVNWSEGPSSPICTVYTCTNPATKDGPIPGFPVCDTCEPVVWGRLKRAILVMPPVEALRLAVNKGVFGEKTLAILRASLEAADQEALIRAEQLAAAREHAGQTWETWQEERAQGSPF